MKYIKRYHQHQLCSSKKKHQLCKEAICLFHFFSFLLDNIVIPLPYVHTITNGPQCSNVCQLLHSAYIKKSYICFLLSKLFVDFIYYRYCIINLMHVFRFSPDIKALYDFRWLLGRGELKTGHEKVT